MIGNYKPYLKRDDQFGLIDSFTVSSDKQGVLKHCCDIVLLFGSVCAYEVRDNSESLHLYFNNNHGVAFLNVETSGTSLSNIIEIWLTTSAKYPALPSGDGSFAAGFTFSTGTGWDGRDEVVIKPKWMYYSK